jgi:hypothetical protein
MPGLSLAGQVPEHAQDAARRQPLLGPRFVLEYAVPPDMTRLMRNLCPRRPFPNMTKKSILLSFVIMAVSSAAFAQAPPTPVTPPAQTAAPAPRANNCAPMESMPKEGSIAPQGTTTGQRPEALGDKLAKSDGVLCPPAGVDPQMHAPTPDTGNTPVIRPPGSPGGDPTIRPK